jgi:hypothetical protein
MNEIIWTAGAGRELQEIYEQLEDVREESGTVLLNEAQRILSLASSQPFMGKHPRHPLLLPVVQCRGGSLAADDAAESVKSRMASAIALDTVLRRHL